MRTKTSASATESLGCQETATDRHHRSVQTLFPCSLCEECRPLHDPKRGVVFDELQAPIRQGFAVASSIGSEVDVVHLKT